MRVAVLVVLLVAATPSEASPSCMSKTEARQRFGSVHIYWHGKDHCWDATLTRSHQRDATRTLRYGQVHRVQQEIDEPKWHAAMSEMLPDENTVQQSWVDRWVIIEPPPPIASRWVDIAQVTPPPPIIEPNPEPTVVPRGVLLVLVFVVLAMALAIVEVLLRIARAGNEGDRAAA
jgi:hypothetical protein